MKMKVIRDASGKVINIGEWDFMLRRENVADPETGEAIFDEHPLGGFVVRTKQVMGNPPPEGAYEDTAEIITGWDGGLYEEGDPRALAG